MAFVPPAKKGLERAEQPRAATSVMAAVQPNRLAVGKEASPRLVMTYLRRAREVRPLAWTEWSRITLRSEKDSAEERF